jgi:SAM-dependent methyltransferase
LGKAVIGTTVVSIGTTLGRAAVRILLALHGRERIESPAPLIVGDHTFDVFSDLIEFTGLPRETVLTLLGRQIDSHRVEWHLFPRKARSEEWFYRSSRTYLFANAVHSYSELAVELSNLVPAGGRILDYGGGTGNFTLALAALGFDVDFLEISAVQKDFVRFRVRKHGLEDHVTVLDDWVPLDRGRYDFLCAMDVLEHLPRLEQTLRELILGSLKQDAGIVELSPFVRNFANPMHFEHGDDLDDVLNRAGFRIASDSPERRIWRRSLSGS